MKPQDKIGKYLVLEEQEKVATGSIWRVAELDGAKISRHLLVDLMDGSLEADPGFVEQYMSQSLVVSKLEHPNVLRKIMGHHEGQQLASVFEFHEGFTLACVLKRCRTDMYPFTLDHALLVASKLLSALAYSKTKHMAHGFINPSQVFVTHEGEIKLKGFALSSALRACKNGRPKLDPELVNFIPAGDDPISENRDHLDIFGVGAILYEMLIGEPFHKASGDAVTVLKNARTDADGESIPPKIAKILVCALDPNRPDSYKDIQKMAKDMDDLLFSGEYSPTTFNLAFFMHSAFREEMDGLGSKLKQELEHNYAVKAVDSGPAPARQAAPPKRAAPMVGEKSGAAPMAGGSRVVTPKVSQAKSKLPMILGAVAAFVLIAVLVTMFLLPKEKKTDESGFEEAKRELEQEGKQADQAGIERQRLDLERQNAALLEENRAFHEAEKQAELKKMKEQIAQDEEEMAGLQKAMERASSQKASEQKIQELTARLEKQKEEEAVKLEELRKSQAENLAKALAAAEESNPETTGGDTGSANSEATGGTALVEKTGPEVDPAQPIEAMPEPEAPPKPVLPPEEGDLVALDDEMLEMPVILEGHVPLDAPRRAVKDGKIGKGRIVSFIMKVLVSEKGHVDEVELYRNPLGNDSEDYGMAAKAERAARKIRWSPPMKLGVKVKVWAYVPIHFRGK